MELPLMNPGALHWLLVGVLLVLPMLVLVARKWRGRRHGGVEAGWGGALFVSLCWLVALALILAKVAG